MGTPSVEKELDMSSAQNVKSVLLGEFRSLCEDDKFDEEKARKTIHTVLRSANHINDHGELIESTPITKRTVSYIRTLLRRMAGELNGTDLEPEIAEDSAA